MKKLKTGIFIVLEGIDGSGKTTLAKKLYQHLTTHNFPVLLTREPGGSQLGKHIRILLQEGIIPITHKTEYLLFAADRAQHMQEVILPALNKKQIIISDRFCDSSMVYQGYGRNIDPQIINTINNWSINNLKPDLTFYIKISAELALKRRTNRGKNESFDNASPEFFNRLIYGYETLYAQQHNIIIVDGQKKPNSLTHEMYNYIIKALKYD